MNKALAIILFFVFLNGCATSMGNDFLLNAGDSKARVIEVMGEPRGRQLQGQQEAWHYCGLTPALSFDHRVIWFTSSILSGISSFTSEDSCAWGTVSWENAPDSVIEIRNR